MGKSPSPFMDEQTLDRTRTCVSTVTTDGGVESFPLDDEGF